MSSGESFDFDGIKKSIFQALFLSGIPFFAYVNFIDSVKFSIIPFLIASFLCAFSVSNLNVFFERKNLFPLVLSVSFFILGLLFTFSGSNLAISFVYVIIYLTWGMYYIIRKIMFFPDVLLHIAGGILISSFGLVWGTYEKTPEKLFDFLLLDNEKVLLSLFVSFAFTAGYLIDIIDDMEEDRKIGQKNLAEKIGVKLTFLLSAFLFFVSYINGFFVIKQDISKIIFISLFLTHLFTATILFFSSSMLKFIPNYRNFYRVLFVLYCLLITYEKKSHLLFFL